MARLRDLYFETVLPELKERFGYTNNLAAPRLVKISINMGVGRAVAENKPSLIENAQREMTQIVGQRAVISRTRMAVAASISSRSRN